MILLTRRKATTALTRKANNYPDLLPETLRYCITVRLNFNGGMNEV